MVLYAVLLTGQRKYMMAVATKPIYNDITQPIDQKHSKPESKSFEDFKTRIRVEISNLFGNVCVLWLCPREGPWEPYSQMDHIATRCTY
jgi:hypothetical protein